MTRMVFKTSEPDGIHPLVTSAVTSPPAVEVAGLTAGYDGEAVLADITFSVPTGELVAVIGPNGAGKSSLFKVLTGMLRPSRGRLRLCGAAPAAACAASRVAYMPQHESLDWDYPVSVRDVVMGGRLARIRADGGLQRFLPARFAGRAHHEAVRQALDAVDLWPLADRHISMLSGGQRKRTLLARALAQDAELLLLDEPLAGVDVATERLIYGVLSEMRGNGRTVMMVTHDLAGARTVCDRAILLNRHIQADGPPSEVLDEGRPTQGSLACLRAASGSPAIH